MAITNTIDKLPTAADVNVTIKRYAASELSLQAISREEKAGSVKLAATFVRNAGDPNHPMQLTVNAHYDPTKLDGVGETSVTFRLEGTQVTAVDGTETALTPVQAGVFYRSPGHGPASSSDMMKMISAVYGLLFTMSGSPAAPSTAVIESISNGQLDIVP